MKLDSKYFDCIRVKPDQDRLARERQPICDWEGCSNPGGHPAPKGRGREGEYFQFCLDHVRQYNKSYNYFNGMSDDEVASFQKANVTGHRPTWSVGTNSANAADTSRREAPINGFRHGFATFDPLNLFGEVGIGGQSPDDQRPRSLNNAARKSLTELGLDGFPNKAEIKARFKELVKRHHPDSNASAQGSEEKLREVIQAYNYLKRAGLC